MVLVLACIQIQTTTHTYKSCLPAKSRVGSAPSPPTPLLFHFTLPRAASGLPFYATPPSVGRVSVLPRPRNCFEAPHYAFYSHLSLSENQSNNSVIRHSSKSEPRIPNYSKPLNPNPSTTPPRRPGPIKVSCNFPATYAYTVPQI